MIRIGIFVLIAIMVIVVFLLLCAVGKFIEDINRNLDDMEEQQ